MTDQKSDNLLPSKKHRTDGATQDTSQLYRLASVLLTEIASFLTLPEFRQWMRCNRLAMTIKRRASAVHLDYTQRTLLTGPSIECLIAAHAPFATSLTLSNVMDCVTWRHIDGWERTPWYRLQSLEIVHVLSEPLHISALVGTLLSNKSTPDLKRLVIRSLHVASSVVQHMIQSKITSLSEELVLVNVDKWTLQELATLMSTMKRCPSRLQLDLDYSHDDLDVLVKICKYCSPLTSLTLTWHHSLPYNNLKAALLEQTTLRQLILSRNFLSGPELHELQRTCSKLEHFHFESGDGAPLSNSWTPRIAHLNQISTDTEIHLYTPPDHHFQINVERWNEVFAERCSKMRQVRMLDYAHVMYANDMLNQLALATKIPWHTIHLELVEETKDDLETTWRTRTAQAFFAAHASTLVDCRVPAVSWELFASVASLRTPRPMRHLQFSLFQPPRVGFDPRWKQGLTDMTNSFPLLETLVLDQCDYALVPDLFQRLPRLRLLLNSGEWHGDPRSLIEWTVDRLWHARLFAIQRGSKRETGGEPIQMTSLLTTLDVDVSKSLDLKARFSLRHSFFHVVVCAGASAGN